jgi:hypothetical protein
VERLKEEIAALVSEQVKALEQATYLGLTAEEASVLDARRTRILRLKQQLEEE